MNATVEVESSGTGNLPVPLGHWPDGKTAPAAQWRTSNLLVTPSLLPSGRLPLGTGHWPVPPSAAADATSAFWLNTFVRHPLRVIGHLVWLLGELVLASLNYFFCVTNRRRESLRTARAFWLQRTCRRLVRIFNVGVQVSGPIPARGLLVCNHLSYLDILVLGSLAPVSFVSKHEVRQWPVFGWFARFAGTIFVHRDRRGNVARSSAEIGRALDDGALVVLFPEGTSSDGRTVLPFKSALLEPATQQEHPLAASFICYTLTDGSVPDEVCYWRDMTLLPHLLNLLGKRGVSANVSFAQLRERSTDRKELARQLHSEVVRLKEGFSI